jgi:predicted small metal-binding protein
MMGGNQTSQRRERKMTKSISCNCGWHEHGTEEELVNSFVQHVQEGHGKQVSREQAASLIREE